MSKSKFFFVAAIAFTLSATGCSAQPAPKAETPHATVEKSKGKSSTPTPTTVTPSDSPVATDSEDTSNGDAPTSTDTSVPAASNSAVVPGTKLRSVHSPTSVANDISLAAGQCKIRTVDASTGLYLPDPNCTPGAIDPAVTQDNIGSTICKSGYTTTVRAPVADTDKFKALSLRQYGISANKTTEYDHLVSLQLGGTNAVSNLWVEPNKAGAAGTTNPKDAVETKLKVAVCAHKVTLAQAQQAIATDWTTAEKVLGL